MYPRNQISSLSIRLESKFVKFLWVPSHVGIVGNEITDFATNFLCTLLLLRYHLLIFSLSTVRFYIVHSELHGPLSALPPN